MHSSRTYLSLPLILLVSIPLLAADPGSYTLVDSEGKEIAGKKLKFLAGTRRLAWENGMPEALEFREDNSTTFVQGILSLVPMQHIRSIEFDVEKQTMSVRVATATDPQKDLILTGTTKYQKLNKLTLEAETGKYQGGIPKSGIRALRFDEPQPVPALPPGRKATLHTNDKQKATIDVVELKALYVGADGTALPQTTLHFRKTFQLDLTSVERINILSASKIEDTLWNVKFDAGEFGLTHAATVTLNGKMASLEGVLGRSPAGWKLFPPHTVSQIVLSAVKTE
jgi:hypothetical protein